MKSIALAALLAAPLVASAQWNVPPESQRCPSKWGAGDERGSGNHMKTSEIGQVGTQFDGFAHQSHGESHYNCFKTSEISTRAGFSKLGVQNAPMFFTRGVLIDVAGLKSVEMLGDTYEITVSDLQQALERQKLKLQPGDAVIIHTGWGKLYGKDNARYVKSCPGIGVKAAEWLIAKDPVLLGSD